VAPHERGIVITKSNLKRHYIRRQKIHHRKLTFKDEFIKLLEKHGVEFDRRYLWK